MEEITFAITDTLKHNDRTYMIAGRAGENISIGDLLYYENAEKEKIIFIVKAIEAFRKKIDVLPVMYGGHLILDRMEGPHRDFVFGDRLFFYQNNSVLLTTNPVK